MINKRNVMLAAGAVTLAGGLTLAGAGAVSAAEDGGKTSLIDKITTKFNLNKDEVEKLFSEHHQAMRADHQAKLADRLGDAVEAGKLTATQKDLVLAKLKEQAAFHESLKDKSAAERHEVLKQHREELKQWAEDNDIPLKHLARLAGHGHGPGHGFGPGGPKLHVGGPQLHAQ